MIPILFEMLYWCFCYGYLFTRLTIAFSFDAALSLLIISFTFFNFLRTNFSCWYYVHSQIFLVWFEIISGTFVLQLSKMKHMHSLWNTNQTCWSNTPTHSFFHSHSNLRTPQILWKIIWLLPKQNKNLNIHKKMMVFTRIKRLCFVMNAAMMNRINIQLNIVYLKVSAFSDAFIIHCPQQTNSG